VKLAYSPNFLAIIVFLLFSAFALKDLTIPGFYTSHDGETHVARIAQYYQALKDGQIPPRFAGSFYNNFESPIFVYIYPTPYFFGSLAHLAGFSFVNSFKLLMALGFIFSSIFCYAWLKELFKSPSAAFLGAMVYAWSPYRFQLIYVRGSISEHLAYTFVPLALYSLTKLKSDNRIHYIALSAVSIALIMLSQNLVALISMPLIGAYVVFLNIVGRHDWKFYFQALIAAFWGFLLSAFTYLPSLFERKYIVFDKVFSLVFNSHFVTFWQLIRSPWGYGFDLPGVVNDQLSFQMGLIHLLIIMIFIIYLIQKTLSYKFNIKMILYDKEFSFAFILIIIILIVFLVLQNNLTAFVWNNFKPLQIIDIPWRLLGLIPIIVALAAAFLQTKIKSGLFLIIITLLLIYANRNHIHINKPLFYDDQHFMNYHGSATQLSEFTPITFQTTTAPTFTDLTLPFNTVGGWVSYENMSASSKYLNFNANVISDKALIRINKFYFPGINITFNGEKVIYGKDFFSSSTGTVRLDSTKNTHGFIFIPVQKGNYNIKLNFGETNLRLLADLISLLSLLFIIILFYKCLKKTYYC